MSVYNDGVYRLALEWIRVGAFPVRDDRASFTSADEIADFAAYVLDHAEDLEDAGGLDAAGYSVLAKRSHRQETHGAWVQSEWPTGCRECGRHCEQGSLVLLRRRLNIGAGVLCETCGEALLVIDDQPLFVPEGWA